jgi:predicted secreted protein
MSNLSAIRITVVVVLVLLGVFLTQSRAEVTTDTYNVNVGIGEVGQVRLHVNPSTGCSWWVESAPPASVVDISVSSDVDPTIDCGNPPRPGCSNEMAVYSFRSNTPGTYTIELRYGHAWAHSEYYTVAMVQLTVTGPTEPPSPLDRIIRAWNSFLAWLTYTVLGRCQ